MSSLSPTYTILRHEDVQHCQWEGWESVKWGALNVKRLLGLCWNCIEIKYENSTTNGQHKVCSALIPLSWCMLNFAKCVTNNCGLKRNFCYTRSELMDLASATYNM
jgi:hypothetical protein